MRLVDRNRPARATALCLALFPMLCGAGHGAYVPDPTHLATLDSLFGLDTDLQWVETVGDSPVVYVGAAFRTLPFPPARVAQVVESYDNYRTTFKYVREFVPIEGFRSGGDTLYAAYFELGTPLYKLWSIGKVDSVIHHGDTALAISISQITDAWLNDRWRSRRRAGLLILEAHNLHLVWRCRMVDDSTTRVGFAAWLTPSISIPQNLFRFACKYLVPRFLKDVERRLKRP